MDSSRKTNINENLSEVYARDYYLLLSVPVLNSSLHFLTAKSELKFLPELLSTIWP